ncbi:MAG: hypothetical protein WA668_14815 [Candidatus Cybelea sp.]
MLTSSLIGGYVVAIAIDASDNVFITYDNASFHTELLEFAKEKGTGEAVNVTGYTSGGENPIHSKLNRSNSTLDVTSTKGLSAYSYPAGTFKYSVTNQMGQFGAGGMAVGPPSRR